MLLSYGSQLWGPCGNCGIFVAAGGVGCTWHILVSATLTP